MTFTLYFLSSQIEDRSTLPAQRGPAINPHSDFQQRDLLRRPFAPCSLRQTCHLHTANSVSNFRHTRPYDHPLLSFFRSPVLQASWPWATIFLYSASVLPIDRTHSNRFPGGSIPGEEHPKPIQAISTRSYH